MVAGRDACFGDQRRGRSHGEEGDTSAGASEGDVEEPAQLGVVRLPRPGIGAIDDDAVPLESLGVVRRRHEDAAAVTLIISLMSDCDEGVLGRGMPMRSRPVSSALRRFQSSQLASRSSSSAMLLRQPSRQRASASESSAGLHSLPRAPSVRRKAAVRPPPRRRRTRVLSDMAGTSRAQ